MDINNVKRGFNNGYLLQAEMPDLAKKFAKTLADRKDDYAVSFIAGIKEREREAIKSRAKNYNVSKMTRNKNTKPKDKDRNKDDRDR